MTLVLVSSAALLSPINASAQIAVGYDYSPWFEAIGDNYVDIPNASNLRLTKFSVAAWFKTSANYFVNGFIVNKGGAGSEVFGQNMNYGIWLTSEEKLRAGFESGNGTDYYVTHNTTFNDGNWHYVVLTYDGNALRLYVDGSQLGWRSITAKPEASGTKPLRIGANSQAESGYFMGQLDEIRVWNRAISSAEVSNQYQSGIFDVKGMNAYFNGVIPPAPDVTPPTIIVPPDRRVMATGNLTLVDIGMPAVADEGDVSPVITNNASSGFPVGTTTITWNVTDASGNIATADQSITVIDPASSSGIVRTFCALGCDFNNLQTAINSLPAAGGKIHIEAGVYLISNTRTLKSNTVIEFDDQASIFFAGNAKPVFNGTGLNNIEVIGGKIAVAHSGVKAFSFVSSSGITISGTKMTMVKGLNSNAFSCVDCSDVYISNIDASSASRLVDIKTSSDLTDGKSTNIWIQDSAFDDSSVEGLKVNHSNDVHIINNTLSNTGDNGIDIGWNANTDVAYNRLTRTGYPNGAAIGTDSANGADVLDNYINTTGKAAIQVYRASNINLGGNTIIDAGNQGVSLISQSEPSANVKVISNHIISPGGYGIYVSRSQVQVEIGNNVFEQMPAGIKAIYIVKSNNGSTTEYGNLVN